MKSFYWIILLIVFSIGTGLFFRLLKAPSSKNRTIQLYPVKPTPLPIDLKKNILYFTFDADMTPKMEEKLKTGVVKSEYDPALISYLEENKIPATFFVTGMFAETYPDLIKELATKSYFSIENHTYNHAGFENPCFGLAIVSGDKNKISEMQKTQNILKNLTGTTPIYLRHPGLCHNQHDDDLAAQLNLKVSDDGITSGDAFNPDADKIVNTVLSRLNAGQNIIMHVGGPNTPATTAAVKKLVPLLETKGYTFGQL